MKKLVVSFACFLGLSMGLNDMAQANLITNGSFEGGTQNPYQTLYTGDSIPGWTVTSGSVDWINNYWAASAGSNSLDLAGYYQPGVITSAPFSTVVGETYRVQFDMAGNPDRTYDKTLASFAFNDVNNPLAFEIFTFQQAGHTASNMGWESKYFDFVAAELTTQIAFADFTLIADNAFGAALDNVDVAPVPEPSTFLLLGAGLAGIGIFGRKLRRSKHC
jgi:choice-of-anchor C domain-containing protein